MAAQNPFGTAVSGFADPRYRMVRLDPLLLVATVGLLICSLYTLETATQDDVSGSPYFYLLRQAIYAVVGLVLMYLVSRFDYSRLRELKLGLYGVDARNDRLRARARGRRAWLAPLDRAAVLPLPALRARQAAPDRRAVGLPDRPHPPQLRTRD